MKTVIFTATKRYGGMDVLAWNMGNLSADWSEVVWVIGDELYDERGSFYYDFNRKYVPHGMKLITFDTKKFRAESDRELYRTLAHSYNHAMDIARAEKADLFISLQDYIVPPSYGIKRFERMAENDPGAIYTGLCSFADKPTPADVTDPTGLFTVFERPFSGLPDDFKISWADVREDLEIEYAKRPPVEWEANWSAVPKAALENPDLRYNGDYDIGVAYENQGYSFLADSLGIPTVVDMRNHAYSLDHKNFFPEDEKQDAPRSNMHFHESLWNSE